MASFSSSCTGSTGESSGSNCTKTGLLMSAWSASGRMQKRPRSTEVGSVKASTYEVHSNSSVSRQFIRVSE